MNQRCDVERQIVQIIPCFKVDRPSQTPRCRIFLLRKMMIAICAAMVAGSNPGTSLSADQSHIWVPAKLSDTSYSTRLGLIAPGNSGASGGFDVGLRSETKGGHVEVPIAFWGRITSASTRFSARRRQENLEVTYQANTGEAIFRLTESIKQILSSSYDLDLHRDVSFSHDGKHRELVWPDINQAFKLSHPASGAALGVHFASDARLSRLKPKLTVEKRLGSHAKLTGVIAGRASAKPYAEIRGEYSISW